MWMGRKFAGADGLIYMAGEHSTPGSPEVGTTLLQMSMGHVHAARHCLRTPKHRLYLGRSRHTRSAGPIRRCRQHLGVVFYRPSAFFGVFLLRLAAFNHPPFVRHFFPNGPLSVCSCSLRGLGQLSSEVTRCNQQIRHHT